MKHNKKISPVTEYWLNRVLRDHSKQIFVLVSLILIVVLVIIVYNFYLATKNPASRSFEFNVSNFNNVESANEIEVKNNKKIIINGEEIAIPGSEKSVIIDGKNQTIRIEQN